jgi:hypothetical protein
MRTEPELRREVRASLALQLVIVGVLLAALGGLLVQLFVLLRDLPVAASPALRWGLPAVVVLLGWIVARRFFRVWRDYRQMRPD